MSIAYIHRKGKEIKSSIFPLLKMKMEYIVVSAIFVHRDVSLLSTVEGL